MNDPYHCASAAWLRRFLLSVDRQMVANFSENHTLLNFSFTSNNMGLLNSLNSEESSGSNNNNNSADHHLYSNTKTLRRSMASTETHKTNSLHKTITGGKNEAILAIYGDENYYNSEPLVQKRVCLLFNLSYLYRLNFQVSIN